MSIPDETLDRWAGLPRPGTPGPWIRNVGWYGGYEDFIATGTHPRDDGYRGVARVAAPQTDDAIFIAAAPEMREAIDVLVARVRELQAGVDRAASAMRSSKYVGGPTEREAWRSALDALGPLETQHIGMGDA